MGQLREVAGCTHAPLVGDDREQPELQELQQARRQIDADTRNTSSQRAGTEQQQRAHDVVRQRLSNGSSVRTHEGKLHLREIAGRDPGVGKRTEAGRDAVHHAVLANGSLNNPSARLHARRD